MVYRRFVEEALVMATSVLGSCGGNELLEEAIELIRGYVRGELDHVYLYEAAELMREAAYMLRSMGCLDWYRAEEAAGVLEQALP